MNAVLGCSSMLLLLAALVSWVYDMSWQGRWWGRLLVMGALLAATISLAMA